MAKMKKKGTSGAAVAYITRTQAMKKLQLSLADFRRLCILKGIYPREPKNKKKVNKGSSAARTWYFTKDIRFLQHEPLLAKFREQKTFLRRLTRALHKDDLTGARRIEDNKPVFTLDHIIKERYPTFLDAVRDLDDTLCLLFLFATFPASEKLKVEQVDRCKRLTAEFQMWVMREQALRKVFISIKGIYYQAEIRGQTVTWLVPHPFTQRVPKDVDFRVMLNFLQFYESLLGFVNYKLYSDSGLVYPPRIDQGKEEQAADLAAVIIETTSNRSVGQEGKDEAHEEEDHEEEEEEEDRVDAEEMQRRVSSLQARMSSVIQEDDRKAKEEEGKEGEQKDEQTTTTTTIMDEFSELAQGEERDETLEVVNRISQQARVTRGLFGSHRVFLSRETPRNTLTFILRSFGVASLGWDATVAAGSPMEESSTSITLQVVDRPTLPTIYPGRVYVQPQYIFDSVNAGRLLDPAAYAPGSPPPPHLSPFVTHTAGDYVPAEAAVAFTGDKVVEEEEEEEEKKKQKKTKVIKDSSTSHQAQEGKEAKQEEADRLEMAKAMMSKKNRVLYEKMQYGKDKKRAQVEKLEKKKRNLEESTSSGGKKVKR
ncbi:MAG: pescadillo-family BRCT domain protein [Piptocephalis tieghemiana]|nr:MAG: pescadillo-family BRCT domain protein [Piptocephalis tieghemiana]